MDHALRRFVEGVLLNKNSNALGTIFYPAEIASQILEIN